ncbi:MAG: hypothetical protein HY864_08540 [Chloroflexi bacterium]|nr:hypothetical protein [Chloroflexota bacterium]
MPPKPDGGSLSIFLRLLPSSPLLFLDFGKTMIIVVKYIDFLGDRQYTVASFSSVHKNIASALPCFVNHFSQGTYPNVCWNANIERV